MHFFLLSSEMLIVSCKTDSLSPYEISLHSHKAPSPLSTCRSPGPAWGLLKAHARFAQRPTTHQISTITGRNVVRLCTGTYTFKLRNYLINSDQHFDISHKTLVLFTNSEEHLESLLAWTYDLFQRKMGQSVWVCV